ncbi:hypothetical protein DL546_002367 [Coniochaeta pulveracea]|uniref:Aminoglycoside phosphotransferase domain-containing protein n=1 Tax=Coniochaeta pulveracea TaxID=177199 RepID=A0A420Y3H3_9PEZI|nr:hypothetical protein DL546_002367 [Coniochaeta pulveracea]
MCKAANLCSSNSQFGHRKYLPTKVEAIAYQWVCDSAVDPKFLGHLTEGRDGRWLASLLTALGARPKGRGARAYRRLPELGIKLGDINKHNFLVRDGHDVVLVDFETAKCGCSPTELDDEMDSLKSSLEGVPEDPNVE